MVYVLPPPLVVQRAALFYRWLYVVGITLSHQLLQCDKHKQHCLQSYPPITKRGGRRKLCTELQSGYVVFCHRNMALYLSSCRCTIVFRIVLMLSSGQWKIAILFEWLPNKNLALKEVLSITWKYTFQLLCMLYLNNSLF